MIKERTLKVVAALGLFGVLVPLLLLVVPLLSNSYDFILEHGLEIITSMNWSPYDGEFGSLQFILGTLWVTFWSTALATPLAVALAVFVTELVPPKAKTFFGTLIDLIAAIPSVIYGYWGLIIFGPLLANTAYPVLAGLSWVPALGALFSTSAISPQCFMTAILVLSLMITPYASAIIRNSYEMIPRELVEAVYALGGTKWDVIRINLGYIKSSILAGVVIAAGRSMGETMAVTMLIGNSIEPFKPCLLCRGATITSLVANEFEEAMMNPAHVKALTALVLILIFLGSIILALGRKLGRALTEAEIVA
ncbi:phosphate ABC transporter, inner membrane subunit PstC [Ignicoccus hospitalis KIN4/I]|uniref:Phosphate transport system permease protein n=2 Tax=Ignicoccus TaxID=54258 RepID=A8A8P0_IGNH4|nr:phosphate ABC transporter, inner membrane subunit PstC [Ignicoccus hospitalis KIN4/I]